MENKMKKTNNDLQKFIATFFSIMLIFGLTSCAKEEFGANKVVDEFDSPSIWTDTTNRCSSYSLNKPQVDFLFLWDNSSSQLFVNSQTKEALNNTIELIATSRFNYHILMAPLIGEGNNDTFLVAENPDGLSSDALNKLVGQSEAANKLSTFPTTAGSVEHGLQRTIDLINLNRSNNIIRSNTYLIIILMSNGDDLKYTDMGYVSGAETDAYIQSTKGQLLNIRDNILHNPMMRFISLVPFTQCATGYKANYSYKKMSKLIYEAPYPNGIASPTDQTSSNPDSYDICGINFTHLFDGVNNSLQDTVVSHVYNFWPITGPGGQTFDPNQVTVTKSTGQEIPQSSTNGFTVLDGIQYNHNLRFFPDPANPPIEQFTGHLIALHGEANYVKYPECLIIKTQAPTDYYGYVHLHSNPLVSSIQLTIDGQSISQSLTNGWELIGYKSSQNIKVISPTNPTPATPAENKTGYFLKLHGSAIFSNGISIKVLYDPQSI